MQRYTISRNGQTYGPYSMDELQRYLASGHILSTDLARTDDIEAPWQPVSTLLNIPAPAFPGTIPALGYTPGALSPTIEPPPGLSLGLYILFAFLTCGVFNIVYEFIQAAWMRRVYPPSRVLFLYLGALLCTIVRIFTGTSAFLAQMHGTRLPPFSPLQILGIVAALAYLALIIAARFTMRSELEQHFNRVEPIGLVLGGFMTFFFGSYYFQYHLHRISMLRRAMLPGLGLR